MTILFTHGEFTSHSGRRLPFKIDCDALTDDDLDCLARWYASAVGRRGFGGIFGVPKGGLRFADALRRHLRPLAEGGPVLIADDVLTTGESMEEMKSSLHLAYAYGVVIFARGRCPSWVTPLFTAMS